MSDSDLAVVIVTRDLAFREARAADEEIRAGRYRGPLHGIPYGAKDLLATRGIPTTYIIDRKGFERGRAEGAVDWAAPATVATIKRLVG